MSRMVLFMDLMWRHLGSKGVRECQVEETPPGHSATPLDPEESASHHGSFQGLHVEISKSKGGPGECGGEPPPGHYDPLDHEEIASQRFVGAQLVVE